MTFRCSGLASIQRVVSKALGSGKTAGSLCIQYVDIEIGVQRGTVSIVCITSFAFHQTHPFGYSPATNFHIVVWKHAGSSVHAPDCHSENQVSTLFHRFERLSLVLKPKVRTHLNPLSHRRSGMAPSLAPSTKASTTVLHGVSKFHRAPNAATSVCSHPGANVRRWC
jgi:hypothetical protein